MRCGYAILLMLASASRALGQEDTSLESRLNGLISAYPGKVAVYATDLRSGRSAAINADVPVPTASVIKLTILFEALKQIEAGSVHFTDTLTLRKSDQVPGSGVLRLFDTPRTLTLRDALTLMIDVSDNTATNLVIDHIGLQKIDARIAWLGLQNTWLYKKVFQPASGPMPPDQKEFGLGKTTAREMAGVMQRFLTCNLQAPGIATPPTAAEQKLCDVAVGMLKGQFDGNDIPRYLSVAVANKTGTLDDVRNDVGIVYAKNGPVIISAFTYDNSDQSWTVDNSGQLLIGRLAKAIIDQWQ